MVAAEVTRKAPVPATRPITPTAMTEVNRNPMARTTATPNTARGIATTAAKTPSGTPTAIGIAMAAALPPPPPPPPPPNPPPPPLTTIVSDTASCFSTGTRD